MHSCSQCTIHAADERFARRKGRVDCGTVSPARGPGSAMIGTASAAVFALVCRARGVLPVEREDFSV